MKFPPLRQKGFTLIELMVVIVIISIIASLIVLNIDGVDQRKAMQARELLILDLKKMNREAVDQSRIYALVIQSQTDVASFGYRFDEYIPQRSQTNDATHRLNHSNALNSSNNNQKKWLEADAVTVRELPNRVSFTVESQDHEFKQAQNTDLLGNNAPKLIWLGNGEVKPVSIQIYYDQKPVGDLIQIDYLGKIDDAS
ncbi:MAG: prepilin-type N-terminal cleavage/methylation domain-containing protein [Acinetobacter sp.]|nr:prepilin-type N-terminal cleavage/methylation domain-containing protein [Acinetobacter sp.]MBP8206562.1 prepilin-type N-terminal cleavage/methylation domain-containing protein [Acinetobacter sp.]